MNEEMSSRIDREAQNKAGAEYSEKFHSVTKMLEAMKSRENRLSAEEVESLASEINSLKDEHKMMFGIELAIAQHTEVSHENTEAIMHALEGTLFANEYLRVRRRDYVRGWVASVFTTPDKLTPQTLRALQALDPQSQQEIAYVTYDDYVGSKRINPNLPSDMVWSRLNDLLIATSGTHFATVLENQAKLGKIISAEK